MSLIWFFILLQTEKLVSKSCQWHLSLNSNSYSLVEWLIAVYICISVVIIDCGEDNYHLNKSFTSEFVLRLKFKSFVIHCAIACKKVHLILTLETLSFSNLTQSWSSIFSKFKVWTLLSSQPIDFWAMCYNQSHEFNSNFSKLWSQILLIPSITVYLFSYKSLEVVFFPKLSPDFEVSCLLKSLKSEVVCVCVHSTTHQLGIGS